jgi:hypothetical protein
VPEPGSLKISAEHREDKIVGRDVKRVPIGWDWPLDKVWSGYQFTALEEERYREVDCPECENGYSPLGKYLHDLWYGKVPFRPQDNGSTPLTPYDRAVYEIARRNVEQAPRFYGGTSEDVILREARRLAELWNGMWSHHLNQADVDALIEAGRLMDFTHTVTPGVGWQPIEPRPVITPQQVNEWSLRWFGHDSINAKCAVDARCAREGQPSTCQTCGGHASLERYPGQRAEAEAWERTEPPTGEGWQLWETVSEGSPISPVFGSAEELAQWMASPAYTWGAARPMTYSAALKFVQAGWSPSFMGDAGGLHEGADYIGTKAVLDEIEGAS